MPSLSPASLFVLVLVALSTLQAHAHAHNHQHRAHRRKRDSALCKPRPSTTASDVTTTTYSDAPAYTSSSPTYTTSSAAPVSTSGTKKWGLAYGLDPAVISNFALANVQYMYDWRADIPDQARQAGLVPIPMLWGPAFTDNFQKTVVEGYATHVLGMNEPNEPSQSNMSPVDGATMWKTYIDPLQYKGYKLISPACTNDQAGLDWYQQFFAACTGCHFDALAFHAYTTDAQAVIDYATTLYNTYKLPIWITEFADQNFSGQGGQASMDDIWNFAGRMRTFINETPWVEAAFPFGLMNDLGGLNVNTFNSLVDNNGPTPLAYFYFG